ncbi:MAG: Mce protein [Mycobacterium sp.]
MESPAGTGPDDSVADEVVDEVEDETAEPSAEPGGRRRWPGSPRQRLGAAVLAALLAVSGYDGWLLFNQHRKDVAAAQALDAAKKFALVLTSMDSGNIDREFTAVLDGSTGEFKDMYTKSSAQLRQLLLENKAEAHGTVLDAAVKSASTDKVVVLLFIDQSVRNKTAPGPQLDRSRVSITMQKVDGHWLASEVKAL